MKLELLEGKYATAMEGRANVKAGPPSSKSQSSSGRSDLRIAAATTCAFSEGNLLNHSHSKKQVLVRQDKAAFQGQNRSKRHRMAVL